MPRVHFVKKARKKNPAVEKGQSYYWWKFRRGGMHFSATPPKQSQLTQSDFWSAVYALQEQYDKVPESDDLESTADEIKGELENIKDETQGKFDNMPEGLQQGDTGQLLEERVAALDEAISAIEGIDFSFDPPEKEDEQTEEEHEVAVNEAEESFLDEKWGEVMDALTGISCS